MLVHRLRRCANIKTALVQCLVFAELVRRHSRGRFLQGRQAAYCLKSSSAMIDAFSPLQIRFDLTQGREPYGDVMDNSLQGWILPVAGIFLSSCPRGMWAPHDTCHNFIGSLRFDPDHESDDPHILPLRNKHFCLNKSVDITDTHNLAFKMRQSLLSTF